MKYKAELLRLALRSIRESGLSLNEMEDCGYDLIFYKLLKDG